MAAAEAITKPFTAFASAFVPVLTQIGMGLTIGALAVSLIFPGGRPNAPDGIGGIPEMVIDYLPQDWWFLERFFLTFGRFVVTFQILALEKAKLTADIPLWNQISTIALATVGLGLFVASQVFGPGVATAIAGIAGLLLSMYALYKVVNKADLKGVFPIVHEVAFWLAIASIIVSGANLARSA